ncbi:MAG: ABC transporter ATP-binding protein [Acidimicrobiia bacterium]
MSDPGAALLELRDVDAGYGPFRALFGLSLEVREGRALALLGANGAGKTTVARVCSGLVRPTSGQVLVDGIDVTGTAPFELARRGVIQAPEGRSVFATLTVEENLVLAFRRFEGRAATAASVEKAFDVFPRLAERRRQRAGTLSGGEQRMLSLARVLVQPPRLLIADELSLGLAPIVVDDVYATLETIRSHGTTLLIIEQHVHQALNAADDVAVLVKGRVTYEGAVAGLGDVTDELLPGDDAEGGAGEP